MLIHRDVLATGERCLHSIKAFPASHITPPVRRLGVPKWLRGDTAGRADSSIPKGYSRPYHVVLSNKSWVSRTNEHTRKWKMVPVCFTDLNDSLSTSRIQSPVKGYTNLHQFKHSQYFPTAFYSLECVYVYIHVCVYV